MIKIPEGITYAEAYITLQCNFKCDYCINRYTGVKRGRQELTADQWITGLNNIDFGDLPLTIGGGEPTIRKDFYDIVNGLRYETKIDLLTNGTFDAEEFTDNILSNRFTNKGSSYKAIRVSFHPKSTNLEQVVSTASILQNQGYPIGIFGLNHPDNLHANVEAAEVCRKAGVYFFVRDFLGYHKDKLYGFYRYPGGLNGNVKSCKCRTSELLIGPEGHRFRCHRDLYANESSIGDIMRMDFNISHEFSRCDYYGLCNPCDLKEKSAPDLKTERCSVEIKEI